MIDAKSNSGGIYGQIDQVVNKIDQMMTDVLLIKMKIDKMKTYAELKIEKDKEITRLNDLLEKLEAVSNNLDNSRYWAMLARQYQKSLPWD